MHSDDADKLIVRRSTDQYRTGPLRPSTAHLYTRVRYINTRFHYIYIRFLCRAPPPPAAPSQRGRASWALLRGEEPKTGGWRCGRARNV
jgi:hypothetical protein